jgi:hypothetical protein
MAKTKKRNKSSRKKSPIAITIIAVAIVVLFVIRLYQVFEPLFRAQIFQNGLTGPFPFGWHLTVMGRMLASSITYMVLSLAGIVVLIGFLRLKRWSWVLLMVWTGISLVISLVDYFYSHANYAVMASNVIIAFALNMTDVQQIFGMRRQPDATL